MSSTPYLMENDKEAFRMEMKTRQEVIEQQALWAGLKPGMRIADIGCGPGKTTQILFRMAQSGEAVGLDFSRDRILYANEHYHEEGMTFVCRNVFDDLSDLGTFDFIWVRFVLEYHQSTGFEVVKRLANVLKPGGIMCLIDLDQNSLTHYGAPDELIHTFYKLMNHLSEKHNFDPYAGRKLYAYLYDLHFNDIDIEMSAHHLFYGKINETDLFNWKMKLRVAGERSGYDFQNYNGGFDAFFKDFVDFFNNPRRFSYTPVICCRGKKPM